MAQQISVKLSAVCSMLGRTKVQARKVKEQGKSSKR
jgi:hypothetical protein